MWLNSRLIRSDTFYNWAADHLWSAPALLHVVGAGPPPGPGLQPLWEVPGNKATGPFSRPPPPQDPATTAGPRRRTGPVQRWPSRRHCQAGARAGGPTHEARRRAARPPARRPPHLLSRSCRTFPGCAVGRGRCSSGPGRAAAGQQAGAPAALLGRGSPRLTLAPAWRAPRGRGPCARRPRSSPHRACRSAAPPPAQPLLRGREPPAAAPRRRPPAGLGPAATAPPAGSPPRRPPHSAPCWPGAGLSLARDAAPPAGLESPTTAQHGPHLSSHRDQAY